MQNFFFGSSHSNYNKLLLTAALLIHLIFGILAINRDNITADEQDHLNYGISVLKGNTARRDTAQDFTSTMPVSALNALPRAVEQVFYPGLQKNDFGKQDTMRGRYITLAFSLLLICLIYFFAKEFAPPWIASVTSFLAATDPNFLAHGHLVTTDIFATVSFLATIYFLYKWTVLDQRKYFFYWCIAIAVAQCCKMNNVILYPISLVIIVMMNVFNGRVNGKHFGNLAIFMVIQLLLINCFFLFEGTGTYLSNADFSSVKITNLISFLPFDFPIPLPLTYLDGFDRMYLEIESNKGFYQNYLLGELKAGKPFPE
ncbi:MAG TPA: glycosyltransferase family 39 protein, partial [Chitinophagaceae bacterium]|nr:glycosyltransferase family 39 protein [Chitinophagaceae bacterium]